MKQTFTYIVSWVVSIASYPCKEYPKELGIYKPEICYETEQKKFTVAAASRDSALKMCYNLAINEITTVKFDSIPNKDLR
jgi:hypothetical protein